MNFCYVSNIAMVILLQSFEDLNTGQLETEAG